jgi:nicotinamidase-related amidase
MCGLVTDICVISNAILLHSAFLSAHVAVLQNLVGTANAAGAQNAIALMQGLGIEML